METKLCMQCHAELKGRIDKKFCDDQCRAIHNNRLKSDSTAMRIINTVLRKNRKLLKTFIPENGDKTKTSRRKLENKGFNFSYYTHTHITKNGTTFFCYEYGYVPLEADHYMLIRQKE